MKKIVLSILLLAAISASAQLNYPRYFQQVNRTNTNRFTTVQSYRWETFIDSTTADTIRLQPSAGINVYSIVAGSNRTDSISHNHLITSNNGNTYLNDLLYFNILLDYSDTLKFDSGSFSAPGGSTPGPYTSARWTLIFNRTSSGKWIIQTEINE